VDHYERDYPAATKRLQDSFDLRKQEETRAFQAAAQAHTSTSTWQMPRS
jgi:hypothetical protein